MGIEIKGAVMATFAVNQHLTVDVVVGARHVK